MTVSMLMNRWAPHLMIVSLLVPIIDYQEELHKMHQFYKMKCAFLKFKQTQCFLLKK